MTIFSLLLPALILTLNVNCSGPLTVHVFNYSPLDYEARYETFLSMYPNGLAPNLKDNCMTNSSYNTCLFWKNPVATSLLVDDKVLDDDISYSSNLEPYQIHAVNISGLDSTGGFSNKSFKIVISDGSDNSDGSEIRAANGVFKFSYGNGSDSDSEHKLVQTMAFYYLNFQMDYMTTMTGAFYAKDRGLTVIAYDPNVEFGSLSANKQVLTFGVHRDENENETGLASQSFAHEMGHVNAYYATNRRLYIGLQKERRCGGLKDHCCSTKDGCIGAIDEGQADYHAAILFPDSTGIFESLTNTKKGWETYGMLRAPSWTQTLTADIAFAICGSGCEGEIHAMGLIYASIWWGVRQWAQKQDHTSDREVDTLFTEHLPLLRGNDDFRTAFDKIRSLDLSMWPGDDPQKPTGKYSARFEHELKYRGLNY